MVDKNKLRAAWVAKGFTQSDVAQKIGVSEATFSRRMQQGRFDSDEIETLVALLEINDIADIFFANLVT